MFDYSSSSNLPWYNKISQIKIVVMEDGVTSIGNYAFERCTTAISATIGKGVESVGGGAFDGCSGLTEVHIKDIASWCMVKFGNQYSNPVYYANNLYLNGELITEITIPDNATNIGDYAFFNCGTLVSVTVPEGVTKIGRYAFYNCAKLTGINVPDAVVSIENNAFDQCSLLKYNTYGHL